MGGGEGEAGTHAYKQGRRVFFKRGYFYVFFIVVSS